MKIPASRLMVHLGLGAGLAAGLFVAPSADAGTQMPYWKAQMLKTLGAAKASAGSTPDLGDSVVIPSSTPSSGGFVSQADPDLVLLGFGNSPTTPVVFNDNQFGGLVSQNELDGVLLNWGDTDYVPPSTASGSSSSGELDGVLLNWGHGTPPDVIPIGAPDPADEYGGAPYYDDSDFIGGASSSNTPYQNPLSPIYSYSSASALGSYANSTSVPAVDIGVGQDDGNHEPANVMLVPEPATGLLVLGAAALSGLRRRRN